MQAFLPVFLVFGGGGTGAVARYLLAAAVARLLGTGFPWGTLAVNVIGAFLIGLLTGIGAAKLNMDQNLRLLLVTGFLGGFTTFSAFSLETALMVQRGDLTAAALYTTASVLGTVILVFAGLWLARLLTAAPL